MLKPPPTNGAAGFAFRQPDENTITPLLIRRISDYGFRTDVAYLNNPTLRKFVVAAPLIGRSEFHDGTDEVLRHKIVPIDVVFSSKASIAHPASQTTKQ